MLTRTLPKEVLDDPALWAIVNRSKSTPVYSWRFDRFWEGPVYVCDLSPFGRLQRWFKNHVCDGGLPGDCILAVQGNLLAFARHLHWMEDFRHNSDWQRRERYITTIYTRSGLIGRLLGCQWQVRTYYRSV